MLQKTVNADLQRPYESTVSGGVPEKQQSGSCPSLRVHWVGAAAFPFLVGCELLRQPTHTHTQVHVHALPTPAHLMCRAQSTHVHSVTHSDMHT